MLSFSERSCKQAEESSSEFRLCLAHEQISSEAVRLRKVVSSSPSLIVLRLGSFLVGSFVCKASKALMMSDAISSGKKEI